MTEASAKSVPVAVIINDFTNDPSEQPRLEANNSTNTFLFVLTSTRHDVGESSSFQNIGNAVHCHTVGKLKNESKLTKPFLKI
jgi:hypothetical protein